MTRKNDTSYRTKGRAVFLAAIMLVSMVAMSAAFAGSAAAVESPVVDYDDRDEFPSVLEEGQEYIIDNDSDVANNDGGEPLDFGDAGDIVYILEVEDRDDNEYSTVRDLDLDDDQFPIDSDGLTEQYVVANASAGDIGDDDDHLVSERSFEVRDRPLDVEWDEDDVTEDDDNVAFELDTDRRLSTMNLTISADGPDDLEHDDLKALFNVTRDDGDLVNNSRNLPLDAFDGFEQGDDREDFEDDGYLTINLSNLEDTQLDGDDLIANFTKLDDDADFPDDGEYEFNAFVTDTGQEASDSISIREDDEDASFDQGVYTQTAGDIVDFEIDLEDTDDVFVQIGDEDAGFVDVLYIEADDRDDTVEFQLNTRTLGTNESTDEVYNDVENIDNLWSATQDNATTFEAEAPGDEHFVDDDGDPLGGDGEGNFSYYLDELGTIDSDFLDDSAEVDRAGQAQLTRPAQPTDYELLAATEGDDGVFVVNDDDESEADDELDNAVLELVEPGLGEVTSWVAPADDANEEDDIDELLDVVTERSDIAIDDRLVLQFEASGLYGNMVNNSDDNWDILDDGTTSEVFTTDEFTDNDRIELTVEGDDAVGNQDPTEIDFDNDDEEEIFVHVDNDEGQFFVVVDTDADVFDNGEPEDGDTFEAELEYDTEEDDRPRFNTDDEGLFDGDDAFDFEDEGFPYFSEDTTSTIDAEFDWEDAAVSFDNLNADDEVQAENIEDSEISGTTNVAPGSNAEIITSSTDASTSFRNSEEVNISEDGEISAEYDFSDQEAGDEFDTRFRVSGSNVDTVDSVIVEEGEIDVEDPEDDEDDVVDDEDDVVDDDDDVVDDDDDVVDDEVDDETDDETPGFGALVALVALIGAALLAARRQNN